MGPSTVFFSSSHLAVVVISVAAFVSCKKGKSFKVGHRVRFASRTVFAFGFVMLFSCCIMRRLSDTKASHNTHDHKTRHTPTKKARACWSVARTAPGCNDNSYRTNAINQMTANMAAHYSKHPRAQFTRNLGRSHIKQGVCARAEIIKPSPAFTCERLTPQLRANTCYKCKFLYSTHTHTHARTLLYKYIVHV